MLCEFLRLTVHPNIIMMLEAAIHHLLWTQYNVRYITDIISLNLPQSCPVRCQNIHLTGQGMGLGKFRELHAYSTTQPGCKVRLTQSLCSSFCIITNHATHHRQNTCHCSHVASSLWPYGHLSDQRRRAMSGQRLQNFYWLNQT